MPILLNWLESLHMDLQVRQKCSRLTNRKSTCSICLEQCLQGAINLSELSITIDPTKCTTCGDCIIACPLSAIEGVGTKRIFDHGCLVYDASFTPLEKELLIYKKRGITSILIDQNPLNNEWEKVLNEVNELLILLDDSPITVKKKRTNEKLSRRAFFNSFEKEGKQLAKRMAPASWQIDVDDWNLAGYYHDYQFFTVEIDKTKCTLCQACFSLCVQNAFTLKESCLQIENEKCVNCNSCTDICPEQAIQVKANIKKKSVAHETIHSKECRACGQLFYTFQEEIEKCHICLTRDPEWLSPYS
ncbi:MAG TPA: 4Fe-4S dicluster domain-containing protein [Neobacillus sp.]